MALSEVSSDCRRRLIAHYGAPAVTWIEQVPLLFEEAAERWGLSIVDYHDAGHASVVATASDNRGGSVLLKAWTDAVRYQYETSVLRLWANAPSVTVVARAEDLAVAALELVGGQPGGSTRPADELRRVAEALRQLHDIGAHRGDHEFPTLNDYIRDEVTPRVRARLRELNLSRWPLVEHAGLRALGEPIREDGQDTVLHGDLYRENVLFSTTSRPVFIDPLPLLGSAAFDWAFWIVYYATSGAEERMSLALRVSGLPQREIRRWCAALFLDGLLYYHETADPRMPLFGATATAFARRGDGSGRQ